MKNCFKKFSIMFVMSLILMLGFITTTFAASDNGVLGVANLNNTFQNSAKVGDKLGLPEIEWKRYDDYDSNIAYVGRWGTATGRGIYYQDNRHEDPGYNLESKIQFNFIGSELRIIGSTELFYNNKIEVRIDGNIIDYFSPRYSSGNKILLFEKTGLENKEHSVEIFKASIEQGGYQYSVDAFDIDSTGQLKPYNESISSISLNKSTDSLQVGESDNLIATTTPTGAQVTWKSSDESVATVDQNGNVTAVGEGNCIITATINDGSNLSDSCTINVTKKDTTEPTEPDNAKAILIINLTDGETKVFDVSYSEVSKFKQWYNTKSEFENKLTYEFNKTVSSNISIEEDVVHDQITSYEIRKY